MKYILHDTSAIDDEKLAELYIKFGYEGTGLFWAILEKIGKQEKPIKTNVLKAQLNVGKRLDKCWKFMESLGIICSSDGETFNKQLLNFSEKYQIKKEKSRERISQWRENHEGEKNVTKYEQVGNAPKVKESKVNRSKVKESKVKGESKDSPAPISPSLNSPKSKHSFRDSEFFDKEKFSAGLDSSPPPYCNANAEFYYDAALNGSDSKGIRS